MEPERKSGIKKGLAVNTNPSIESQVNNSIRKLPNQAINQLDFDKLSPIIRDILCNYLMKTNIDTSPLTLLNLTLSKIAQLITTKRITIKECQDAKAISVNYYGLNFSYSGSGKDKPLEELNNCLDFLKQDLKQANNKYKKDELTKYETDCLTGKGLKERECIRLKQQKEASLRDVDFELNNATSQGLWADGAALLKMDRGCIYIRIDELGDFIESANKNSTKGDFLQDLKKVFEGAIQGTSIKMENQKTEVKGIPCNLMAYSDISNIIGEKSDTISKKSKDYLNKLFSSGLARRAFITYSQPEKLIKENSPKAARERTNSAYKYANNQLRETLNNIYNSLALGKEFYLTEEGYDVYFHYMQQNKADFNYFLETNNDTLKAEAKSRHWKMLKLATIIGALEHPNSSLITHQDINYSIYITELFAKSFQDFTKLKPLTPEDHLLSHFIQNQGKWFTKMEIRKLQLFSDIHFAKCFADALEYCHEMATNKGFELQCEEFGKNGMKYRVIKTVQPFGNTNNFIDHNLEN